MSNKIKPLRSVYILLSATTTNYIAAAILDFAEKTSEYIISLFQFITLFPTILDCKSKRPLQLQQSLLPKFNNSFSETAWWKSLCPSCMTNVMTIDKFPYFVVIYQIHQPGVYISQFIRYARTFSEYVETVIL